MYDTRSLSTLCRTEKYLNQKIIENTMHIQYFGEIKLQYLSKNFEISVEITCKSRQWYAVLSYDWENKKFANDWMSKN